MLWRDWPEPAGNNDAPSSASTAWGAPRARPLTQGAPRIDEPSARDGAGGGGCGGTAEIKTYGCPRCLGSHQPFGCCRHETKRRRPLFGGLEQGAEIGPEVIGDHLVAGGRRMN